MRKTAILMIMLGLIFSCTMTIADMSLNAFYARYVDEKISQCRTKANRVNSRGKLLRASAERAAEQERFYQVHREKLIEEMTGWGFEAKPFKVDYFLIQAYQAQAPIGR